MRMFHNCKLTFPLMMLLVAVFASPEAFANHARAQQLLDYYLRGRKAVSDELISLDCEAKKQLVQTLMGRLKDPDNNVRFSAVEVLAMFGPAAREAVPALIEVLNELRDLKVQAWPPDEQALRVVEDVLVEKMALRHQVSIALEKIGTPEAHEAVRSLVRDAPLSVRDAPLSARLLSESAVIRHAALQEIDSLTPEEKRGLIALLRSQVGVSDAGSYDAYAIDALRKIGRIAVPELMAALAGGDPSTSAQAAFALGAMGPEAHEAIPLLIETLEADPDINVRVAAASALGMIGSLTEEVVPALIGVVNSQQEARSTRVAAIEALGRIGPAAREAIPSLIDELKVVSFAETASAEALGKIGPEAIGPLSRFLVETVETQEREVGAAGASHALLQAIYALGEIGPAANSVVPILIKALEEWDYNRLFVIKTLGKVGIGNAETVPALIRALQDTELREDAALLLAKIGPAAQEAVPAITQILQGIDPNPQKGAIEERFRWSLCFALYRLSPDEAVSKPALECLHREAIPRLIEIANEGNFLYENAIERLSTIGPLATPQLIGALKDEKLAYGSVEALVNIGPSAVPLLTEALKDDQWQVRFHALQALEKIGTEEALDAVKRFRECPNLVGAKNADSSVPFFNGGLLTSDELCSTLVFT